MNGPAKPDVFYRQVFVHASDAILVFRPGDERIVEANPRACEMYGFDRQELIGMDLRRLSSDPTAGRAAVAEIMQWGVLHGYETRHFRKDGALVDVQVHASLIDYEGERCILSIHRDITQQRRAEQRLAESERQYRTIFDESPLAMWIHDPVTLKVLSMNRTAASLYGYRLERCPGLTVPQLCGDPSISSLKAGVGEHRTVCGNWIRVVVTTCTIRVDGKDAVLTIVQNVSDHELILQELANRETWYRCLIENTQDLITVIDRNGNIVYESPSVYRMFGRTPEDLLGKPAFANIHPADVQHVQYLFNCGLVKAGLSERAEFRVRHEDGTWRYLEAIGQNLLDHPAVQGVVIHSRDVTERHRAEDALRKSDEMSRMAQAAGQVGVWEYNAALDRVTCSAENRRLYGLEPGGPVIDSQTWRRVVHPEDEERVGISFYAALKTGDLISEEFRVLWPDGEVHWLSGRGECRRGPDGSVTHIVGVTIDVTERKLIERQMTAARDNALDASRLKSQFLATVSHEIRTPMNGIIGMVGLLLDSELTEEQRSDAETIRTSALYLLELINDLLDFSRLEAGKLTLEACPFDLRECMDTVVDLLAPSAAAKGLSLSLRYPRSMPRRWNGNAGRIRQIVLNFASNAVKFTHAGFVRIEADQTPKGVRITVADTGPGIDAAEQQRLFQKFVQLDGSLTRRHGGAGLGLAISKSLAEAMGGTVGVHSAPGAGSEFFVELPLQPIEFEALPVGADTDDLSLPAPARLDGKPDRILVVEDNLVNQKLAVRLLEKKGLRVDVASNGNEAVQMWAQLPYDLILMDCQMPEVDGYEATRRIRAGQTPRSAVPIVAITAHAGADERHHCMDSGMNDVLTKPFHPHQLHAIVARWLQRSPAEEVELGGPPSPGAGVPTEHSAVSELPV